MPPPPARVYTVTVSGFSTLPPCLERAGIGLPASAYAYRSYTLAMLASLGLRALLLVLSTYTGFCLIAPYAAARLTNRLPLCFLV